MKHKFIFAFKAIVASIALFLVWAYISKLLLIAFMGTANFLRNLFGKSELVLSGGEIHSYFMIPVISVILALKNSSIKRKFAYLGSLLVIFSTFEVISLSTGIGVMAGPLSNYSGSTSIFFQTLYNGFPWIAAVLFIYLFLAGETFRVQTEDFEEQAPEVLKCPICGKETNYLKKHVIVKHGKKKLQKRSIKKALKK